MNASFHSRIFDILQKRENIKYLFILPTGIFLFLTIIYPLGYSFILSFHSMNLAKPYLGTHFVGLGNYIECLSSQRFFSSVKATLNYTAIVVSVQFFLGLGLALVLNSVKSPKVTRSVSTVLILPFILTPVAVGLIWRFLLQYNGIINYFLSLLKLGPVEWLSEPLSARVAIITVGVWRGTPFAMLVLFAGLRSLPIQIYEAAAIDGVSKVQCFRYITLPLLIPFINFVIIMRVMFELKIFALPYALTGGGPARSNEMLSLLGYIISFRLFDMGLGAALSYLIFLIILIFILIYLKLLSKAER